MKLTEVAHEANEADTQIDTVYVPGCPPLGVHGVLGCHGNIAFHAANFDKEKKDVAVPRSGWHLQSLFWYPSSLHMSCVRRLYNEAATVFASLNRQHPPPPPPSSSSLSVDLDMTSTTTSAAVGGHGQSPPLLTYSRRYRACMRATIEAIGSQCADDEPQAFRQVLLKSDMVWHLAEIIFFDHQKGSVLLYQLVEWVKFHCQSVDQMVARVLEDDSCHTHTDYWNAVYICTLQARIDEARKLLRLHDKFGVSEAFASADELLHKMPPVFIGGASVADSEYRWRHWQDECISRQENGEFDYYPRLRTLVKILCGDVQTFEDLAELMGSWYHLMVSFLLYTKPWATKMDIRTAAVDAVEVCGGVKHGLDALLLAATQSDSCQLLRVSEEMLGDVWLPAHLADLLTRHQPRSQQLSQLRELFLQQLGEQLMARRELWQLGGVYLELAGPRGRALLPVCLGRVAPRSERTANKIIHFAESRQLSAIVTSVCRVMGLRCLRGGRQGAALAWALRGDDATMAAHLADNMARHCTRTGQLADVELIDSLGSCVLISDRLMFIGKYREFRRLCADDKPKEASALLVALLTQQLAPEYFWLTLLEESVQFLERPDVVMSIEQTTQLLHCLDTLQFKEDFTGDQDQIARIRRAICHNLARAYIEENTAV